MTVRPARYAATIGLAAILAWGGVAAAPRVVRADEAELQAKVESTIREYNDARSRVRSIDEKIAEGEARASRLEGEMPELKSRASSSIATLYKMSQSSNSLIDLLLSADDFNELITTIQYLDIIATKNNDAVRRLVDAENEMNETRDALKAERSAAERAAADAERAMNDAIAARQAAADAAAAQLAQQKAEAEAAAAASAAGDTFTTESGNVATVPEAPQDSAPVADPGQVTWSERDQFVNEWAGRIDAYLAGSPLGGHGRTFAEAAYDAGIDPRFSPAIATVESSNGAYCFAEHNAWGWGGESWDDWDSAIRDHVAGLARGYGYTATPEGARKYCPPNWEHWYYSVVANMNSI